VILNSKYLVTERLKQTLYKYVSSNYLNITNIGVVDQTSDHKQ